MNPLASSFLLLPTLCQLPAAQDAAPSNDPAPPEGVIARVNGEELSLEGFRDWIVRTHGWRHLDDYVDLSLLQQEARRAGLALPTPVDVDAAFEADWRDQILWRHAGQEAEFVKELAASGLDRQGYRDRRLGTLEQELVAARILCSRPPTDEQKKELWVREFGNQGVRTHLRVAFFDKLALLRPGETAERVTLQIGDDRARAAANAFHKAVAADRSQFAARVASESDLCTVPRYDSIPIDLRARGGDLPRLHADHFGGMLEDPLARAATGDLVGPIATPQGWFVVEVVERSPAPFEAVDAELREIWKTREPSQGEIFWLKDQLRKQSKVDRFPLNPPSKP
jgi:hypothetical protein